MNIEGLIERDRGLDGSQRVNAHRLAIGLASPAHEFLCKARICRREQASALERGGVADIFGAGFWSHAAALVGAVVGERIARQRHGHERTAVPDVFLHASAIHDRDRDMAGIDDGRVTRVFNGAHG